MAQRGLSRLRSVARRGSQSLGDNGRAMPGISIHVVDISRGVVASGMRVELFAVSDAATRLIAAGSLSSTGVLADPALNERFEPGFDEARFRTAEYYRVAGIAAPSVPFLDVIAYRFGIADPEAHYHRPMKCTPWGYSRSAEAHEARIRPTCLECVPRAACGTA